MEKNIDHEMETGVMSFSSMLVGTWFDTSRGQARVFHQDSVRKLSANVGLVNRRTQNPKPSSVEGIGIVYPKP